MRARGFELLIGAYLLGSLSLHYHYEHNAAVYQAEAREEARRVQFRQWRQLARDELRLKSLHDEIEILQREAEALTGDERDAVESIDEMLERWLLVREVWRET